MTWTLHERLQDAALLGRKPDLDVSAPRLARGRIEAEVPDLQHRRSLALTATDQRPEPSQELREGEWLGQVVVGPAVGAGRSDERRVGEAGRSRGAPAP